ncbi:MAG TPA: hypothetical protein VMT99_01840 [Candidatus Paceibacterota bacterium]|nr:hypothetical protein [Candidatus Paceibacterota bacterium]
MIRAIGVLFILGAAGYCIFGGELTIFGIFLAAVAACCGIILVDPGYSPRKLDSPTKRRTSDMKLWVGIVIVILALVGAFTDLSGIGIPAIPQIVAVVVMIIVGIVISAIAYVTAQENAPSKNGLGH